MIPEEKWNTVDWSKGNTELSKIIGCSKSWLSLKRKRLGFPRLKKGKAPIVVDVTGFDWSMNDKEISEKFNISYHLVRTARKKAGVKPHKRGLPKGYIRDKNAIIHNFPIERLGTQNDTILAAEFKCSRELIRQLRVKHNIPKYKK